VGKKNYLYKGLFDIVLIKKGLPQDHSIDHIHFVAIVHHLLTGRSSSGALIFSAFIFRARESQALELGLIRPTSESISSPNIPITRIACVNDTLNLFTLLSI
jgi:hypothetical protein